MFNNLYSLAYTVKTREREWGKRRTRGATVMRLQLGSGEKRKAEKTNVDRGKWERKRDAWSQ